MKVYILTEGSQSIGFGHITRCLSIYQAFKHNNINPKLIINGDDNIVHLIKQCDFTLLNWINDTQSMYDMIIDSDIVIIDSYLASVNIYKTISELTKIAVYMDDNNRISYPKGIVVNGSIYAEEFNYPNEPNIRYLLGTKYIPLRQEFWNDLKKEINPDIKSILITFGGDDIRNLTPKIIKLINARFPEFKQNIIIGKGFKNIKEIENMIGKNTNLIYYPDAKGMIKAMTDSDLAVSAGGQTLYELAYCKIPTIVIGVAENQKNNIYGWKRAGFIELAGWWYSNDIFLNLINNFFKFLDYEYRNNKALLGRKWVDGKGSLNLFTKILDYNYIYD